MFITFRSVILLLGIYPKEIMRKTIKDLLTRILALIMGKKDGINCREMAEAIVTNPYGAI